MANWAAEKTESVKDVYLFLYIQNRIGGPLQFTWDENKNQSNYRKHRVFFETATLVFDDPDSVMMRDRVVDGEERWHTIGLVEGVLLLLVVHTIEDQDEEELVRIISAREATARERRLYEDCEE